MDFVVIPYFLVLTSFGSVINETDNWKINGSYYQPEYTYFVNMNYVASAEKNQPAIYNLNLTSVMKCQAKNTNILTCSLEKKRSILDLKHDTYFDRIQTTKEMFEIYFDKYGVDSIRVSTKIDESEYGLIKLIVSQLNIGTDLRSHRSSVFFMDKENSTSGRCDTLFTVAQFPCKEKNFTIIDYDENYKIRTIFDDFLGDTIILRKRRNVRKCERSPRVSSIEINNTVNLTVASSYSEIHFCGNSFESSTIIEGKSLIIDHDPHTSVFRQVINVRLEKIGKSVEDLSLPTDIATDIIYLHKNVESNHFDM
ncbi:uncharacterized protein LOC124956674 [Vespa velutina]|uniref:uncharacterized protein LOC124956674 n=1 Tax=Vespa velutina TaxID=202808 RepID=UPI001FB5509B|nr:uncharacterized protein LOC124956674 [Vespa velutina]